LGDRRKREEEAKRLLEAFAGEGFVKKRVPDPKCQVCAAPAEWFVSAGSRYEIFCDAHLPPKWRGPQQSAG